MQVRADTRLCLYGFRLRHWGWPPGMVRGPCGDQPEDDPNKLVLAVAR